MNMFLDCKSFLRNLIKFDVYVNTHGSCKHFFILLLLFHFKHGCWLQ